VEQQARKSNPHSVRYLRPYAACVSVVRHSNLVIAKPTRPNGRVYMDL